jgi:hypothetical protein
MGYPRDICVWSAHHPNDRRSSLPSLADIKASRRRSVNRLARTHSALTSGTALPENLALWTQCQVSTGCLCPSRPNAIQGLRQTTRGLDGCHLHRSVFQAVLGNRMELHPMATPRLSSAVVSLSDRKSNRSTHGFDRRIRCHEMLPRLVGS